MSASLEAESQIAATRRIRTLSATNPEEAEHAARQLLKDSNSAAPAMTLLSEILASMGRYEEALAILQTSVTQDRDQPDAWRLVSALLFASGNQRGGRRALSEMVRALSKTPAGRQAMARLMNGDPSTAQHMLKPVEKDEARHFLLLARADIAARQGQDESAMTLAGEVHDIFGAFFQTVIDYLGMRPVVALRTLGPVSPEQDFDPAIAPMRATILSSIPQHPDAAACFAEVLGDDPDQPRVWVSYGHVLRTDGRNAAAIAAYRKAIERDESAGDAWWALANLKTYSFSSSDRQAMLATLAGADLSPADRVQLNFAAGKAMEDFGDYETSFDFYRSGNEMMRRRSTGNAESWKVQDARRVITADTVPPRAKLRDPAPGPIFIVGMPRSGSTLVEQILASHSQIQATAELPFIAMLADQFLDGNGPTYPDRLMGLTSANTQAIRSRYLDLAKSHRETGQAFFIDKMPENWRHVIFISSILPNARIIDIRRDPISCCFSNYKQYFSMGRDFSYDLRSLGEYYVDYTSMMDHVDHILPGRVHRMLYQDLVEQPQREIEKLLRHIGVGFEHACVDFHLTRRPIHSVSSEQVRRPLNRDGMDRWQHFDPWLGPLKDALAPIL
jgi:tetratricopeptide (TPR) repeat protein